MAGIGHGTEAFTSALPSWVNEKKSEVSVGAPHCAGLGFGVLNPTPLNPKP